jgi:hypothetical protein
MKRIERSEILPLGDYETIRPRFRARVIEEKKHRRVQVGPRVTALFENRDTVLLQIQEMLRTERITREGAIQHEIDTYNELIPPDGALSCTMLVEIDDKDERERFLVEAKGLENAVSLVIDGKAHSGKTTPDRVLEDRASAVIYLMLPLGPGGEDVLRAAARGEAHEIALRIEHPAYRASVTLGPEVIASLAEDLSG